MSNFYEQNKNLIEDHIRAVFQISLCSPSDKLCQKLKEFFEEMISPLFVKHFLFSFDFRKEKNKNKNKNHEI